MRRKRKASKTAHRKAAISVTGAFYRRAREFLDNVGGTTDRIIRETLDDPRLAARVLDRIQRRQLTA